MSKMQLILSAFLFVICSSVAYSDESKISNKELRSICEIQERLTNLGFSPGPIDGQVGVKTRNAVSLFLSEVNPKGKTFTAKEVLNYLKTYQSAVSSKSLQGKELISPSRPRNGEVFFQDHGVALAPLEIKTAQQGYDYYVKLSDPVSNRPVKTFYLRSGSTFQIKVPLGKFILKYSTGTHWLGENCLFGLETRFNKADRDFKFEQIGNQISGYTIELIVQKDGNLATQKISAEEW